MDTDDYMIGMTQAGQDRDGNEYWKDAPPDEPQFPEGHVKLDFFSYGGNDNFTGTATINGKTSTVMFSPARPKEYSKTQAHAAFEEAVGLPFGTLQKAKYMDKEALDAAVAASSKVQYGDHAVGPTASAIAHSVCMTISVLNFSYKLREAEKQDRDAIKQEPIEAQLQFQVKDHKRTHARLLKTREELKLSKEVEKETQSLLDEALEENKKLKAELASK